MYKQLKEQKGFTIVEVLIVLAIAGLILLIVFLAVPALQRNARNTSRKEDASHVLAAVSEYFIDNNATSPTNLKVTSNVVYFCNVSGCTNSDAQSKSNLGYYTAQGGAAGNTGFTTPGAVAINTFAGYGSIPAAATDTLNIITGAVCSGNTATSTGAPLKSYVALVGIEASSGYTWLCYQS